MGFVCVWGGDLRGSSWGRKVSVRGVSEGDGLREEGGGGGGTGWGKETVNCELIS